jgi:hypothetical protein
MHKGLVGAVIVAGVGGGLLAEAQPGWQRQQPYEEEKSFVAPSATTVISKKPRVVISKNLDTKKFKANVLSSNIVIDNPYLDPQDPFFNIPRSIVCQADGTLIVASTAKTAKAGRFEGTPYAMGFWRIAADGAITAFAAKHRVVENTPTYPMCDTPFASSRMSSDVHATMTPTKDGGLLLASSTGLPHDVIFKVTAATRVELVPSSPAACAPPGVSKDALARVLAPVAAVEDPRGAIWISDTQNCTLSRVDPDGTTHLVLDKTVACPTPDPSNWVLMGQLAWDPVNDELVTSGTALTARNLYSNIWRVSPEGKPRRVYLALKVGKAPLVKRVDGISGLAVDRKGRIVFGAGVAEGNGNQVRQVDERTGGSVVIAGMPRESDVSYVDGPAKKAQFGTIRDLCFAPDGTLFVNDGSGRVIRKLTTAGQVTTWAF